MAVSAVGVAIGGYPNEYELAQQIQAGEVQSIEWPFYIYFAVTLVMFGCGVWVQSLMMAKINSEKKINDKLKNLLDEDLISEKDAKEQSEYEEEELDIELKTTKR